ncbi:MAG TPA: NADPH-dependent F420 reductase [Candidatus Binatia bacterium]
MKKAALWRTVFYGLSIITLAIVVGAAPSPVLGQAVKSSNPIKIGIIGSGNIGSTLGEFWTKAGHQVLFSSRNPDNLKPLVEKVGPRARAGTVKDAIAFGDVILIAVPYGSMAQIAKDYARDLAGKIVMDAGNAVLARDGEIGKEAREKGVGLTTQRLLPGARVVRAFNTLGVNRLRNNANRPGGRIAIPMAGDDQEALKVASMLVRDAGFDPAVLGGMDRSRLFEQTNPLYGQEISAQEMIERAKTIK